MRIFNLLILEADTNRALMKILHTKEKCDIKNQTFKTSEEENQKNDENVNENVSIFEEKFYCVKNILVCLKEIENLIEKCRKFETAKFAANNFSSSSSFSSSVSSISISSPSVSSSNISSSSSCSSFSSSSSSPFSSFNALDLNFDGKSASDLVGGFKFPFFTILLSIRFRIKMLIILKKINELEKCIKNLQIYKNILSLCDFEQKENKQKFILKEGQKKKKKNSINNTHEMQQNEKKKNENIEEEEKNICGEVEEEEVEENEIFIEENLFYNFFLENKKIDMKDLIWFFEFRDGIFFDANELKRFEKIYNEKKKNFFNNLFFLHYGIENNNNNELKNNTNNQNNKNSNENNSLSEITFQKNEEKNRIEEENIFRKENQIFFFWEKASKYLKILWSLYDTCIRNKNKKNSRIFLEVSVNQIFKTYQNIAKIKQKKMKKNQGNVC